MLKLLSLVVLCGGLVHAAPPTERRLHVDHVDASSFLFNAWNKFQENYHPLYVADDDPTTAWVEGKPGPGIGEWIELKVTPMAGATKVRLQVRNGYQKSPSLFAANARVERARITLLPSKTVKEVQLTDTLGWQELTVEQPSGPLSSVRIQVLSVFAGKKYEDLCISDVQLLVTATSPDNPAFEKARFEKVKAWKAERLAAAQLFKSAASKSLPVAPQYTVASDGEGTMTDCTYTDPLCPLIEGLRRIGDQDKALAAVVRHLRDSLRPKTPGPAWRAVQVVVEDKRPVPRVDGLCTPSLNSCEYDGCTGAVELPMFNQLGWLSSRQLAVFDKKDGPTFASVLKKEPAECKKRDAGASFAWALRGAPAADGHETTEALVVVRCGAVESREGFEPSAAVQLMAYDSDGNLQLTASEQNVTAFAWKDGALAGARRLALRPDGNVTISRAP